MSEEDVFTGRRYEIVAFANDLQPIYYQEFVDWGSYGELGTWLLVAMDEASVFTYSGQSVYCPHCPSDHFTRKFGVGPYSFSIETDLQSRKGRDVVSRENLQQIVTDRFSLADDESEIIIETHLKGVAWHVECDEGDYFVKRQGNALDFFEGIFKKVDAAVVNSTISKEQASGFVDEGQETDVGGCIAIFFPSRRPQYKADAILPIDDLRGDDGRGRLAKTFRKRIGGIVSDSDIPLPELLASATVTAVKLELGWPLNINDIQEWEDKNRRLRTIE